MSNKEQQAKTEQELKESLTEDYDFSLEEIQLGIRKMDENSQRLLMSNFLMSDIIDYMNHDKVFFDLVKKFASTVEAYSAIYSSLYKLKFIMKDGHAKYTDEELKDLVLDRYRELPEEMQSVIRDELNLVEAEPKKHHLSFMDFYRS